MRVTTSTYNGMEVIEVYGPWDLSADLIHAGKSAFRSLLRNPTEDFIVVLHDFDSWSDGHSAILETCIAAAGVRRGCLLSGPTSYVLADRKDLLTNVPRLPYWQIVTSMQETAFVPGPRGHSCEITIGVILVVVGLVRLVYSLM
jgi:hypothetical protein